MHVCLPQASNAWEEVVQWSGSEAEAGKHTPDTLPVTAKLANRRRSMKHDTKRACSENESTKPPGRRPKWARERVLHAAL
jgi:hypothetical protein